MESNVRGSRSQLAGKPLPTAAWLTTPECPQRPKKECPSSTVRRPVTGAEPTPERPTADPCERRVVAEAVSKREITRFSGAALPFPKCREADTEHSGGSLSPLAGPGTRFYTASAGRSRTPSARMSRNITFLPYVTAPEAESVRLNSSLPPDMRCAGNRSKNQDVPAGTLGPLRELTNLMRK